MGTDCDPSVEAEAGALLEAATAHDLRILNENLAALIRGLSGNG